MKRKGQMTEIAKAELNTIRTENPDKPDHFARMAVAIAMMAFSEMPFITVADRHECLDIVERLMALDEPMSW